MDINTLIEKRKEEREWLVANGYSNDDPYTNGEYSLCNTLKGYYMSFVDIGANIGDYSEKVKTIDDNVRIWSFEPNEELKPVIEEKIGRFNKVISKALGGEAGTRVLNVHRNDSTVSSTYNRVEMMPSFTAKMKKVEIEMDILDNYREEICSNLGGEGVFVKIDVEGSELNVMEGAKDFFQQDIPLAVMFEYSFGWKETGRNLKEAFHYLDQFGFDIYRVLPLGIEKVRFYTTDMDDWIYCNYFVVKNLDMEIIFTDKKILPGKIGETEIYLF